MLAAQFRQGRTISGRGIFLVPLNALIQFHAGEQQLGRVLAANNLVQNLVMLGFLALTVVAAIRLIPPRSSQTAYRRHRGRSCL